MTSKKEFHEKRHKMNNQQFESVTNQLEAISETVLKHSKLILPTVSRFFLVSTFIEDGLRMWFQWADQRDYIGDHWHVPRIFGVIFVLYNLIVQLSGSVMVLTRKNVRLGCGLLTTVIAIQTICYSVLWSYNFFLRNLSLLGGIALLFAETFESKARTIFAGVPSLDNRRPQNWMQLIGRLLLVVMFITVQSWEFSFLYLIETTIACTLMFLVTIGWRTRMSALLLACYLFVMNFFLNAFWMLPSDSFHRDVYKYDFFQMLSVIGGLLMLISLGPGRVSIDHSRRNS